MNEEEQEKIEPGSKVQFFQKKGPDRHTVNEGTVQSITLNDRDEKCAVVRWDDGEETTTQLNKDGFQLHPDEL